MNHSSLASSTEAKYKMRELLNDKTRQKINIKYDKLMNSNSTSC